MKCKKSVKDSIIFSFFRSDYIEQNIWEHQSHFERIADFLLEEADIWKKQKKAFIFWKLIPVVPKSFFYFQSFTISEELSYVETCWEQCAKKQSKLIPAKKIKIEENKITTKVMLTTLKRYEALSPGQFNTPTKDLVSESCKTFTTSNIVTRHILKIII